MVSDGFTSTMRVFFKEFNNTTLLITCINVPLLQDYTSIYLRSLYSLDHLDHSHPHRTLGHT